MQVDTSHQIYSSEASLGGITIRDQKQDFLMPMFIAMDPPKHDAQRKVVNPIVAPDNLAKLEGTIRERPVAFSIRCRSAKPSTGSTKCRSS
jgi:cytochrome P450